MDVLRETLMYKDVPVRICMKQLTRAEQYECMRLILAHNSVARVSICSHESTNAYIDSILKTLKLSAAHCGN